MSLTKSLSSVFLASLLGLACALGTGCEGTLGPGDAPESGALYYHYGLDEGPNATKRTPNAIYPEPARAHPYRARLKVTRVDVAPVESATPAAGFKDAAPTP